MAEGKDLVISLREMYEEELKLEKLVEDGKEKNFGKLLDYMLDPREDALNPVYNADEIDLRDRIASQKENAIRTQGTYHPDYFDLIYVKKDNSLSDPLQLHEHVSDYPSIVRQKTRKTELGEEIKYDAVDLFVRYVPRC